MQTIKTIEQRREFELSKNISSTASWHDDYKDSAYIFVGGLSYQMNEGDIAVVFSQFGEIVDVHLVRDKKTGKSKGFAFLAYENQKSTILAVDNFNGSEVCGRKLRVDHVKKFRVPKDYLDPNNKDQDLDIEDNLYKPSGPDGMGWGQFREKTQEDSLYQQQQEELRQQKEQRNRKILEHIQETKKKQIILDEDERWEKLLMGKLEEDDLKKKIEELQNRNKKQEMDLKKKDKHKSKHKKHHKKDQRHESPGSKNQKSQSRFRSRSPVGQAN